MNPRRTHYYHLVTPSGLYDTFKDGVKEVDALNKFLERECKKSINRKYGAFSCVMFAGISQRDPKLGEVYFERSGAPIYIPHKELENSEDSFTRPHLHIILLANPGHEITGIIMEYFKKRHYDYFERTGNSPIVRHQRDDSLGATVHYAMRQSEKFRTFHFNAIGFEEGYVDALCSMVEHHHRSHGGLSPVFQKLYESLYEEMTPSEESDSTTLLTFSAEEQIPFSLTTTREDDISETSFQPVCNNITTITSNTNNNYHHRYTIANLLDYLWRYITHSKISTSNKLIVAGNSS